MKNGILVIVRVTLLPQAKSKPQKPFGFSFGCRQIIIEASNSL